MDSTSGHYWEFSFYWVFWYIFGLSVGWGAPPSVLGLGFRGCALLFTGGIRSASSTLLHSSLKISPNASKRTKFFTPELFLPITRALMLNRPKPNNKTSLQSSCNAPKKDSGAVDFLGPQHTHANYRHV